MESLCNKYKPKWNPEFWNNLENDDITNCYSYAFNYVEKNLEKKLQPGELSNQKFESYNCNEIEEKLCRPFLRHSAADGNCHHNQCVDEQQKQQPDKA